MEETLYTAGEIARIAGVSLRTIRFYDEKGLLKPVSYSEAGYRCYNQESLAVLQRILMLKYLGFSLQRIEEVMTSRNMELRLSEQKELLIQKKRQQAGLRNVKKTWICLKSGTEIQIRN